MAQTSNKEKLSQFCLSVGNSTRIGILERLASENTCVKDAIIDLSELSKFTIGINLKALKKSGLINGTFTSKNTCYCIDYDKLEEFKTLFDEFYTKLIQNREKVNPANVPCNNKNIVHIQNGSH